MTASSSMHSRSNSGIERLKTVRGFIFDMDGTLVLGDKQNNRLKPLPGATEMLAWLRVRNIPYTVFTNGTARSPRVYAETLREAGFELPDQGMLTPASSAASVFVRQGHRRAMILGGDALAEPLHAAGIETVRPEDYRRDKPIPLDAVLIGWYRQLNFDVLENACHAVEAGARLYSSSDVIYFAAAGGRAMGTSRIISAMIKEVTQCDVNLVGKPSLDSMHCAAERMGIPAHELAVVGDDPLLEVPMAHVARACGIAVNTGLGKTGAYQDLPATSRPHLSLSGVDELLALCQQHLK